MLMIRNERGDYKNTWQLQMVYIIPLVLCTMRIIPYNLHRTLKMLSFHTALYTLTQKAVILSTCPKVRKFLTEQ